MKEHDFFKQQENFKKMISQMNTKDAMQYLIHMRLFKDDRYVIQKDKIGLIEKKAKNLNEQTIAKRLDFIMDIKKKIRQNTAFRLSMEVLFMNLKES